jgi:predicted 3-demethylubiquinone-9 3-methyltransferase (glyoxalase superfamily)
LGWCKDKWGLSWQITPITLTQAITEADPAAANRTWRIRAISAVTRVVGMA